MALTPKEYKSVIAAHIERAKAQQTDWDRRRAFYQCKHWGSTDSEQGDLYLENGHLFGFVDSMVASICPPNPRVTANAKHRIEEKIEAAFFRQALINNAFYEQELFDVLWKGSTHASVYGLGIFKCLWNESERMPDYIAIDPRHFFFDRTSTRWKDVRYCIELAILTRAEFESRVKKKNSRDKRRVYDEDIANRARADRYPTWLLDERNKNDLDESVRKVFQYIVVYEVLDFTANRAYHMLEGVEDPLWEGDLPYVFVRNPYRRLVFNEDLETLGGLGDATIIENPLGHADELDTLELRFAQSCIPITALNKNAVDDIEKTVQDLQTKTSPGDAWVLDLKDGFKPSDAIGFTPTSQLSPNFTAVRSRIDDDIMFRLGMPQYTRGVAGTSDVATDLALIQEALQTRQGRRITALNSVIRFLAESTIGLYEEFMTDEETIAARLGRRKYATVQRSRLMARDPEEAEEALKEGRSIEKPMAIDYEIVVYSPSGNSKSVKAARLERAMPILAQLPRVNMDAVAEQYVELLELGEEILRTDEEMAAISQQNQAAQAPVIPTQGSAPSADTIDSGGMPGVVENSELTRAMGAMTGGAGHPAPVPGEG